MPLEKIRICRSDSPPTNTDLAKSRLKISGGNGKKKVFCQRNGITWDRCFKCDLLTGKTFNSKEIKSMALDTPLDAGFAWMPFGMKITWIPCLPLTLENLFLYNTYSQGTQTHPHAQRLSIRSSIDYILSFRRSKLRATRSLASGGPTR